MSKGNLSKRKDIPSDYVAHCEMESIHVTPEEKEKLRTCGMIQDGSVTKEKLSEEVLGMIGDDTDKVDSYTKEEIRMFLSDKQNASDDSLETEDKTIVGAINELQKSHLLLVTQSQHIVDLEKKADKGTVALQLHQKADKDDTYTRDAVDNFIKDIDGALGTFQEDIAKKTEETILYEDVVNTPEWANRPTSEHGLDGAFNTTDFYYVTLKDANGNPLPSGQFMLKDTYIDGATVYPTVFVLTNLNTGTSTLVENYPVEFISVGLDYSFRDAGVTLYEQQLDGFDISNGTGSLRIVVQGEVIPRNTNLYVYSHFKTDKNVASYHSTNGTTSFQSNSTKDIVAYITTPELSNVGNMLYDNTVLKKDGSGYFSSERNVVIRYSDKNAKAYQVFGFGKTLSEDTNIASIAFRLNNVNNGMLRNGTKIIISEVK